MVPAIPLVVTQAGADAKGLPAVAVHGQDAAVAQLDQVGRVTPHRSHLRLRPAIAAVVRSHLPQVVGLLAVAHMAEKPFGAEPYHRWFTEGVLRMSADFEDFLPGMAPITGDADEDVARLWNNIPSSSSRLPNPFFTTLGACSQLKRPSQQNMGAAASAGMVLTACKWRLPNESHETTGMIHMIHWGRPDAETGTMRTLQEACDFKLTHYAFRQ